MPQDTASNREPARLRDLKVGVRDLIFLDPRTITVEPGHNPRDYNLPENRAHLDQLKASIRENGTLQALLVRWDNGEKKAFLVDGECRLRANLELIAEGVEIASVPTYQVSAADNAERLAMALTGNTGKPLSKMEEGAAYKRLSAYGWTNEMISKKLAKPLRYVGEAIELCEAPAEVRQMVSDGTVSPAAAVSAVRESGSRAAGQLRERVARSGGSVVRRERAVTSIVLSVEDARKIARFLRDAEFFSSSESDQADNLARLIESKLPPVNADV